MVVLLPVTIIKYHFWQVVQWVPRAAAAQRRDPSRLLPRPLPENIVIRAATKRGSELRWHAYHAYHTVYVSCHILVRCMSVCLSTYARAYMRTPTEKLALMHLARSRTSIALACSGAAILARAGRRPREVQPERFRPGHAHRRTGDYTYAVII